MLKSLLTGAILASMAATSNAASWIVLGATDSLDSIIFYDADSVMKRGSSTTVWLRWVYENPTNVGARSWVGQERYHCDQRSFDILYSVAYDDKGGLLAVPPLNEAGKPVVPGSLGESVFEMICATNFPNIAGAAVYKEPDAAAKLMFKSDAWKSEKAKLK